MNKSLLEQTLWSKWVQCHDRDTANDLVQMYMYLVHFHVERLKTNLPKNVQKEELMSHGIVGLFDAIKKFDPGRDLKFETYASFRVRGAMIDGLRKEDWLPRSIRDKVKKLENTTLSLEQTLNRPPTSAEIAVHMGLEVKEIEHLKQDTLFANVLSIDEHIDYRDGHHQDKSGFNLVDNLAVSPEDVVLKKELESELVAGIKKLNHNEQLVVSLYYEKELTLTEIGQVLDLTTSRISQIHRKAIFKLRHTLEKIRA